MATETESASFDWLPGAVWVVLDVAMWLGLYLGMSAWRGWHNHFSLAVLLISVGVVIAVFSIIGGYNRRTNMVSLTYASEHLIAVVVAFFISAFAVYLFVTYGAGTQSSRGIFIGSFALFAPLSLAYRRWIYAAIQSGSAAKHFMVLGDANLARSFYENYLRWESGRQKLRFFSVENQRVGEPIAGPDSPLIEGNVAEQLQKLGGRFDGIILATERPLLNDSLLARLIRIHFRQVPVYTIESFYEQQWRKVPVFQVDLLWPLQQGFQLARHSIYDHVKRLVDVVVAGVGLVVTAPLCALIALIVRLDSRGPVIFRQLRVGKDERLFTLYKFRTMHPSAENGDIYTRQNDSRVTRAGKWLRRMRLDELPQLWNVLKGDMSLIGPRAEWVKCVEKYEQKIPHYHFRHLVKPGITGWAQVNYPYGASEEDAIEKLRYDLYYIRHYSLQLDASIVLKTLHVMSFGKGT